MMVKGSITKEIAFELNIILYVDLIEIFLSSLQKKQFYIRSKHRILTDIDHNQRVMQIKFRRKEQKQNNHKIKVFQRFNVVVSS